MARSFVYNYDRDIKYFHWYIDGVEVDESEDGTEELKDENDRLEAEDRARLEGSINGTTQ